MTMTTHRHVQPVYICGTYQTTLELHVPRWNIAPLYSANRISRAEAAIIFFVKALGAVSNLHTLGTQFQVWCLCPDRDPNREMSGRSRGLLRNHWAYTHHVLQIEI